MNTQNIASSESSQSIRLYIEKHEKMDIDDDDELGSQMT